MTCNSKGNVPFYDLSLIMMSNKNKSGLSREKLYFKKTMTTELQPHNLEASQSQREKTFSLWGWANRASRSF